MNELASLIDMLRGKGVTKYQGCLDGQPVILELGPALIPDAPKSAAAVPDPEVCRCGHSGPEHNQGLCLRGCDPEQCANPESE